MKKVLLFLLLFCSSMAFSQSENGTLVAEIVDKATGEPVPTANMQLFQLPDTVFKVGTVSDFDGRINAKAQPGKYIMRISFVGYVTLNRDVVIEKGKVLDAGRIELVEGSISLKEAVVTAEVPPVTTNNDTLVYNTAAFRVPEGSMLEELIKKYPGVTIEEDGTIKINGKTVNRILMKGKDFFGEEGFQVAFEVAGVESSVRSLMENIEKGGTVVIVAVFSKDPALSMFYLGEHELNIVGTMMYRHEDYVATVDAVAKGTINLEPLISNRFSFEEYDDAYKFIDDNRMTCMKVIIDLEK